jgi:hypothetical protein
VTAVRILYTNYRGETAWRHIRPVSMRWGSTEHHPEPQWLLDALDLDRNVARTFAMKDVQKWEPA